MDIKRQLKPAGILFLLCLFTTLSRISYAAPPILNYQGNIVDGTGVALSGAHNMHLTIYDAATVGNTLWTDTQSIEFDNGYFSVYLGSDTGGTSLDPSTFDTSNLYLGIAIDSDSEMTPRQRIVSSAFAINATNSENALTTDWSNITGVPADFADGVDDDTLLDLGCIDGQTAKVVTGVWTCDPP